MFAALLVFALAICAAAQRTIQWRIGDAVQTPNGKSGVIESWQGDVIRVKI